MRIATWNVNSLKARLPRVEEWMASNQPDVLCLQETKLADEAFPEAVFTDLGYEAAHHGDGRWNGVAVLSRVGLEEVVAGFGGATDGDGCRLLAATCNGVRVHSVYVPNGRSLDNEHYSIKLAWLSSLRDLLDRTCDPAGAVVVAGDFNVAPDDRDVWDPEQFVGTTHTSDPERSALFKVEEFGLVDAFRLHHDEGGVFSWWDYRAGSFHKGWGMRIDLVLLSRSLAESSTSAVIDRNARKGPHPSDHAPVVVEVEL